MRFYLGTHRPTWLARTDVPLFVSRRVMPKVRLPRAAGTWALDSGGFTELSLFGEWTMTASRYAALVRRYHDEIGGLEWAAPQDWMCEAAILKRTGRTVAQHQHYTVQNFLELRERLGALVIPVLQGFDHDDYLRCRELYERAGVVLAGEPLVGLGSICRRQNAEPAARVVASLRDLRLHGFGVKLTGLRRFGHMLASADSLAWSFRARRGGQAAGHTHNCASCLDWALEWRRAAVTAFGGPQQTRLAIA